MGGLQPLVLATSAAGTGHLSTDCYVIVVGTSTTIMPAMLGR